MFFLYDALPCETKPVSVGLKKIIKMFEIEIVIYGMKLWVTDD